MKKALIIGVTGQDGVLLANYLLAKGYEVTGTSRNAATINKASLQISNLFEKSFQLETMAINNQESIKAVINKCTPHEIYNLAGQTSVALSFQQPNETFESIAIGTLNILEAIRLQDSKIKFWNASSGDTFGEVLIEKGANENTPFNPCSPYGVAKLSSFWQTAIYRKAYGMYACSGMLFNHESVSRPERFVTKKVIIAANRIAKGSHEKLKMGNLDIKRDWGWAPEYVEAMYLMLQQSAPEDFILATGVCSSLKDFIQIVFEYYNLNWEDHVLIDPEFIRASDIMRSVGDPSKAEHVLGWKAKSQLKDIIKMMITHYEQEQSLIQNNFS